MTRIEKITLTYTLLLVLLTGLISADWFSGSRFITSGATDFFWYYLYGIIATGILTILFLFIFLYQQATKNNYRWTIVLPVLDFFIIYINYKFVMLDMFW